MAPDRRAQSPGRLKGRRGFSLVVARGSRQGGGLRLAVYRRKIPDTFEVVVGQFRGGTAPGSLARAGLIHGDGLWGTK